MLNNKKTPTKTFHLDGWTWFFLELYNTTQTFINARIFIPTNTHPHKLYPYKSNIIIGCKPAKC